MLLIGKIQYTHEQKEKLKTDFESIMTDQFINILTKLYLLSRMMKVKF